LDRKVFDVRFNRAVKCMNVAELLDKPQDLSDAWAAEFVVAASSSRFNFEHPSASQSMQVL
jgi:hypothetical protein